MKHVETIVYMEFWCSYCCGLVKTPCLLRQLDWYLDMPESKLCNACVEKLMLAPRRYLHKLAKEEVQSEQQV